MKRLLLATSIIGAIILTPGCPQTGRQLPGLILHTGIQASIFWVGEEASDDNGGIPNSPSCWQDSWVGHHGCEDWAEGSCLSIENPYYVALPYSDFKDGQRKQNAKLIPWAQEKTWGATESMFKNRWVQVVLDKTICYAQVEDCGPYLEDDTAYVFGSARPKNKKDLKAGIDLSPAVGNCLGNLDNPQVDWQFVDERAVPEGPWLEKITRSGTDWRRRKMIGAL